jgi:hypothetical protein
MHHVRMRVWLRAPARVFAGGEGATAREVLRHKGVEKVVMVDIDKVRRARVAAAPAAAGRQPLCHVTLPLRRRACTCTH